MYGFLAERTLAAAVGCDGRAQLMDTFGASSVATWDKDGVPMVDPADGAGRQNAHGLIGI